MNGMRLRRRMLERIAPGRLETQPSGEGRASLQRCFGAERSERSF